MKNIVAAIPNVIIAVSIMGLLAFLSFNCVDMPLAPVAPMSDIKMEGISIIDVTRTFADFLSKDTTLTRNSDGTSSYIKSKSLAPQSIPAITLQPKPSSHQVTVGQFQVNGFSKNSTIVASSISPMLSGPLPFLPEGSYPVSGFSISDTSFDYVRINSGALTLTITNNMPVPIDFPNPIVLHNNWANPLDTSFIASFPITGTINPGGTVQVSRVIDGTLLRGVMGTDSVQVHTSGSLSPVTFTSLNGISISFQSPDLSADSTLAMINKPQTLKSAVDSVIIVDSLTVINSADFTEGVIIFRLVNKLGIDVGVSLTVNEMKKADGSFFINEIVPAHQTNDINLDFREIRIQADLPIRQYGTSVKFSVNITTLNSEGAKKLVTKNDFVQASFIPQDPLIVHSVYGKIQPTIVQINSGVASGINGTDLGNFSAQVALKGMQLTLNLPITGGFPTDYHVAFIAKSSRNNLIDSIVLISSPTNIDFPRIDPISGLTSIHLAGDSFNNFISKFFPEIPDSFFVRGYLTMDPPDVFAQNTAYSIYDTTKVYPSFDMNFPAAVGIKDGVIREVLAFGKDQLPKDFTKSIEKGSLTFYFYNAFPFKMSFLAKFLGNYNPQTQRGDTLLAIALSNTIQPAAVNSDGVTTAPTFSEASVSLNSEEMGQFNKADSLYIRFDMSTSNNGQVVRVRNTDYIRVYAKGDITYTMNKP